MALIQMGPNITGIRNSVAGQTFSQNKGGAYTKAKPIPTNPRTAAQQLVRANFAANSKQWSGALTDAERAAWTFFAQNNPYTNVFGQSKQLSGMSMMMKLNQVLTQIGEDFLPVAPSDLSVPTLATATGLQATLDGGNNWDTFVVDTDAQTVVAGAKYYVFATPFLAAGKSAGQSDYRWLGAVAAVAAATSFDIQALWEAVFGTLTKSGGHVSVLVATVNVDTGALTPALVFDTGILT